MCSPSFAAWVLSSVSLLVTSHNCPKHISCSAQLFQLPHHVHVFLFSLPVVLVVLCLRYRHLHHYYHRSMPEMHCVNTSSLVAGLISALGLLTVGSFQVSVPHTHHSSLSIVSIIPLPTHTHRMTMWLLCTLSEHSWRLVLVLFTSGFSVLSLCVCGGLA